MAERFDTAAAVRRAMHLANALGAAWARDEMMENPRTFKTPAAEQALREYLEQAFAEATSGVRVDRTALWDAIAELVVACGGSAADFDEAIANRIDAAALGVTACPSCLTTEPPIPFEHMGLPMTRCPKCRIELNAAGAGGNDGV